MEGMSHLVRNSILAGILGIVECCLLGRHNIDQLTCSAALKHENSSFLNSLLYFVISKNSKLRDAIHELFSNYILNVYFKFRS